MPSRRSALFVLAILSASLCWNALPAQEKPPVDPGVFGEMKTSRAVDEHRRISLLEIQPARVHLSKQRDQFRRRGSLMSGCRFDIAKELFIR